MNFWKTWGLLLKTVAVAAHSNNERLNKNGFGVCIIKISLVKAERRSFFLQSHCRLLLKWDFIAEYLASPGVSQDTLIGGVNSCMCWGRYFKLIPSKVLVNSLVILKIFRENDPEMCFLSTTSLLQRRDHERGTLFQDGWGKKEGLNLGLFSSENQQTYEKQKCDARCCNLPIEYKCRWKSHCLIPFQVHCLLLHWKGKFHLFFPPRNVKKLSNKREQKLFHVCENVFTERQWKCGTGRL